MVLLVEDDDVFAAALAEELRGFQHDVTVAEDGRAALAAIDHEQFDAVVLDWMMPGLDGVSMLKRLRDGERTLPVIMLSALGSAAEKVEGLEAGADDYVVKPVAAEELNARLNAVVRGRKWLNAAPSQAPIRCARAISSSAQRGSAPGAGTRRLICRTLS